MVQNIVEKIKKHLRNLQAENDIKFKKLADWPKNLVSYKKKKACTLNAPEIKCQHRRVKETLNVSK